MLSASKKTGWLHTAPTAIGLRKHPQTHPKRGVRGSVWRETGRMCTERPTLAMDHASHSYVTADPQATQGFWRWMARKGS